MSSSTANKEDLLDTALHGIYIPTALLIVGVALVKPYWTPYAIIVAGTLALIKLYRGSMCIVNVYCHDPANLFSRS